jgi:hypothetical protein
MAGTAQHTHPNHVNHDRSVNGDTAEGAADRPTTGPAASMRNAGGTES